MRHVRRFENPILAQLIRQHWKFGKVCFALILQSILLLIICQLLFHARLGKYTDLIFLAEVLLVLIISPYLSCSGLNRYFVPLLSRADLQLSRIHLRRMWLGVILGNQIYTFCFLGLTALVFTIFIPSITKTTSVEVIQLHLIFGLYTVVAALVGGLWWRIFRHKIFALEVTYLGWCVLIGGVFLLIPLERYIEDLQPAIPPFLHLNPLIAVCHLLELDVFRTPHLYDLTPVPSYHFVYPSWHIVCGWQTLIGICCVLLARWHRT